MFIFEQCPKNFSGKVFTWKPARSQLRFNTTDSTNPLNLAPSDGNARVWLDELEGNVPDQ